MKKFLRKYLDFYKFYKHSKQSSFDSKKYWESRYLNGGNSGSGSYGHLAMFKANVLNDFVEKNQINSVIEFGCGDGNQLNLANYPKYLGYDVSRKAIEICSERFAKDPTKKFKLLTNLQNIKEQAQLCLSLDVLFHLVEYDVFDAYMKALFKSSTNYVIIYASNREFQMADHVKSRDFTKWITNNFGNEWKLLRIIENQFPYDENKPYDTSFSDFFFYSKLNF